MGKFIRLRLYPELREGAELVGVFNKLEVYLLSNEAIILFKSITERERDLDDIAAIIESRQVDWERLMRMAVEVTERELGEKGSRGIVMVYELPVLPQCLADHPLPMHQHHNLGCRHRGWSNFSRLPCNSAIPPA